LWLSDNYLTSVEGLAALVNLQELNLARNDISFIGHHLDQNTQLQRLNLSDNKISNFRVRKVTGQAAISFCWVGSRN
jgi:Leucine-rich repeat (LRR) protein